MSAFTRNTQFWRSALVLSFIALSIWQSTALAAAAPAPHNSPSSRPAATPQPRKAARVVVSSVDVPALLARYRTALSSYRSPQTLSYIYTIDQVGQRELAQTHLIYRDRLMVRDETIALGSSQIKPRIRISRNRPAHYAIEAIAPRPGAYRFRYLDARIEGARMLYRFAVTPVHAMSHGFTVTQIELDGQRYLPATISFRARGASSQGTGLLRYTGLDGAWLIAEAQAEAGSGRRTIREHLLFADYHVMASLPPATFGIVVP